MITSVCNLGRQSGMEGGGANEQILRLIIRIGARERKGKMSLRSRVQLANASRAEDNCLENVFQVGENLRR